MELAPKPNVRLGDLPGLSSPKHLSCYLNSISNVFKLWMISSATFLVHALGACVNKIRKGALVLTLILVCWSGLCLGQDEIRSDAEVRNLLAEAAKLTGQVEGLRDRMVVSVRLGLANWKSGDSNSAKINFDGALECVDGFPPQEQFAAFYQQSVAEARMEVGDVEGADRTLERIKDDSQRSEAFRTVGLLQARRGDFKGAIRKAPAIENAENRDEFLQSISEMQLASNPHKSQEEDESLYADPCLDIAAADGLTTPDEKAVCLAYWGGQLAVEGQIGAALEILRRAHKESRLIVDLKLRAYTLGQVARGQAQAGSMNEATRSLAEAKPIALAAYRKIKEHGWTSILQDLVQLEVEWGDIDGAGSALGQVEDGEKMNEVQNVARAAVVNGHKKEALAWATSQISPRDRALALIGIAGALLSPTQSTAIGY
jgi:tetratricopeptide (TPR) repeat protein